MRRRLQRQSQKTPDKIEFRRCQIILQWAIGAKPEPIARALGCSVDTVYRTVRAFRQHGEAALVHRTSPGRPRKVTREQDTALDRAMEQEPRKLGQNFSNWTAHRLALLVQVKVHAVTVLRPTARTGFEQAYVNACLAGLAGSLVAGMLGDWFLPFVYNIGIAGFRASVLGWLFLGGLVALEGVGRSNAGSHFPPSHP